MAPLLNTVTKGTFDGQGHRITGLAIISDDPHGENAALFDGIGGNGEVKNLQLVDVDFNVKQGGVSSGIAWSNFGTLTACSVTGTICNSQWRCQRHSSQQLRHYHRLLVQRNHSRV